MDFGELAAHGRLAASEFGGKVGKRCRDPRPGFEKHQGRRDAGQFGNPGAARSLLGRQKPGEKELIGRQTGDGERRERRGSAGERDDDVPGFPRRTHELEARIGDERRAGV